MNFHKIDYEDQRNGEGLRTVLWVSGCEHHCKGCQNPQTWDPNSGDLFLTRDRHNLINSLRPECISGVTFTGGDPLFRSNMRTILPLCMTIKKLMPDKTIWLYTGFTYEYLMSSNNFYYREILQYVDVLVDGRYIEEQRDIELKWRGSANQRVIDVQKSSYNNVVLYCD